MAYKIFPEEFDDFLPLMVANGLIWPLGKVIHYEK
jgi:hypothetical protein